MLADSNDSSLPEDSKESTGSKQAADGETRKNVCGKMILLMEYSAGHLQR